MVSKMINANNSSSIPFLPENDCAFLTITIAPSMSMAINALAILDNIPIIKRAPPTDSSNPMSIAISEGSPML